jgi:hypothetical protein
MCSFPVYDLAAEHGSRVRGNQPREVKPAYQLADVDAGAARRSERNKQNVMSFYDLMFD